MLPSSRQFSERSRNAVARSTSLTTRIARSAPTTTRCCAPATFTLCASRTLEIQDGIPFVTSRQRALLTTCRHWYVLHWPIRQTSLTGMALSCCGTSAPMAAAGSAFVFARRSRDGQWLHSCITWSRRAPIWRTAVCARTSCAGRLGVGQMSQTPPNALQRLNRPSRTGCNHTPSRAGSLSWVVRRHLNL